uniref:Uncharacterized protein n=1 Tax=Lepeophtheirus salmonis TaxID=72036 RepID=A0A0K2TC49_LEPSM
MIHAGSVHQRGTHPTFPLIFSQLNAENDVHISKITRNYQK